MVLALTALASLATFWNVGIPVSSFAYAPNATEDPALIARTLNDRLETGQIAIPSAMAQAVRTAARRDPLGGSGALLAGLDMRAEGRTAEALALFEVARTRDPRNRSARALLLEAYLRAGNVMGGSAEIVALNQLAPEAQAVLLPMLWSLIKQPATQAAAIAAIPDPSPLRLQLAQSVAAEQLGPEIIVSLLGDPRTQDMSDEQRQGIASLILPYIQADHTEAAIFLSGYFYPSDQANPGLVTDPEFSGLPGPPFGWQLEPQLGGLAELRGNQLWVSHYGRDAWAIARQALYLAPGTYQLSYSLAESTSDKPNLVWRIECLPGGTRLLDLPLNPEFTFGMAATDRFTIPGQDCRAQWLVLAARVDDAPSTRVIAFRTVEITPAGGSR